MRQIEFEMKSWKRNCHLPAWMETTIGPDCQLTALFFLTALITGQKCGRNCALTYSILCGCSATDTPLHTKKYHDGTNSSLYLSYVGCGWFPGDSSELSLDWKNLPGIESRLGLHKYCQFTLSIFSRTKKRIEGTSSALNSVCTYPVLEQQEMV